MIKVSVASVNSGKNIQLFKQKEEAKEKKVYKNKEEKLKDLSSLKEAF